MYITVTMKEVDELVACGVDILAVQGTSALRPDGSTAAQFIEAIKAKYPEQLVMADCATIEEGIACANAGADFVGTTMRGYTPETQGCDDIDFDFIHELSEKMPGKDHRRGTYPLSGAGKEGTGGRSFCTGSRRCDHKTGGDHGKIRGSDRKIKKEKL